MALHKKQGPFTIKKPWNLKNGFMHWKRLKYKYILIEFHQKTYHMILNSDFGSNFEVIILYCGQKSDFEVNNWYGGQKYELEVNFYMEVRNMILRSLFDIEVRNMILMSKFDIQVIYFNRIWFWYKNMIYNSILKNLNHIIR